MQPKCHECGKQGHFPEEKGNGPTIKAYKTTELEDLKVPHENPRQPEEEGVIVHLCENCIIDLS